MLKYKQASTDRKQKRLISEGMLVIVEPSPDTKVRMQDPEYGHLLDVHWAEPIVGVVTKFWGSGMGIRELELFSSGEFLIVTTNNGFSDLEVLG